MSTAAAAPAITTTTSSDSAAAVSPASTTAHPPLPKIIPPADPTRRRTLVLCFDGTGDQFDADNSNVIQFFTLLQKDDHTQQMVYYQAGIGTYTVPQIATPFWANFSETIDAAIAWNLDTHVMDGYVYLMQNYQAGDKICIFGFSRGAYTARSLAGMIHKVGLLPACNNQQVPFAYKMFTRCDDIGWKQSVAFKKAFSINVDIEFVGVWDTVSSVGLIPRRLPFVSSNTAIRYFRHAVSLDERRAKFKANLYNRPTKEELQLGVQPGEMPTPTKQPGGSPAPGTVSASILDSVMARKWPAWHSDDPNKTLTNDALAFFSELQATMEGTASAKESPSTSPGATVKTKAQPKKQKTVDQDTDEDDAQHESDYVDDDGDGLDDQGRGPVPGTPSKHPETDVLEVWFAGCHCDVGGGSVKNGTRHNLARIPLRWMIRQCFLANTGIRFHTSLLRQVGLDPANLYPVVQPRPPALYVSSFEAGSPGPVVQQTAVTEVATQDIHTNIPRNDHAAPSTPETVSSTTPLVVSPSTDTEQTLINRADTKLSVSEMLQKIADEPGALTEEEEDLADALCPIYDQLDIAKGWWILEVVPMIQRYQEPNNKWKNSLVVNWGRGRDVPTPTLGEKFYVHRSVDIRMQAKDFIQAWNGGKAGPYVPKAKYNATPHWVE